MPMEAQLFHIFRNNPFGRETLLQSIYFCKKVGASPVVYIPKFTKFLMYFDNDVVQIDLDNSYISFPDTAKAHATELLEQGGLSTRFFEPKHFTATTLPDIHTDFDYMACPRSISDLSTKIGLGYIGPKVRRIVNSARFPVLITSPVYKEWDRIAVFFGGSTNAVNALKLGFRICRETGLPLDVFTYVGKTSLESYQQVIRDENLEKEMDYFVNNWHVFETGNFEDNLYEVPHTALAILGAYGHGLIKTLVFGSKMEKIQSSISNNLLIVGPNYVATH
jgi:hypothetical protein